MDPQKKNYQTEQTSSTSGYIQKNLRRSTDRQRQKPPTCWRPSYAAAMLTRADSQECPVEWWSNAADHWNCKSRSRSDAEQASPPADPAVRLKSKSHHFT